MRKITQTIVGTTPPLDKNVLWLDTTNSKSPVEKVFLNGAWIPTSAAGGYYYTKDEVDENFMGKIDDPHVGNILVMDENGKAVDSLKKPANFLANATNEGEDGQVLSLQSSGPAWVNAPQGTVIVDEEMSDISENPVQNKAIKQYVDNADYARKDGYYSQMTVGAAETLVGETVDSADYLIRPTGGESNEVANGVASVLGMEGNSVVWNQLAQVPDNSFVKSKVTIANGKMTFVSDGTSTVRYEVFYKQTKSFNIIIGHYYYIAATLELNFNGGTPFPIGVAIAGDTTALGRLITDKIQSSGRCSGIMQATVVPGSSTLNNVYFNWSAADDGSAVAGATFSAGDIVVIDLTLLGIDNFTTTDQVKAWLAKNVGLKPYYGYNAGSLLSAQTLGIKTYGQNLLNPTTKQAKLIPYTWEENSNVYTIKNVPSGATATFTPDATGVAESITITNNEFDITNYGSGILELSAATADTYVCMKWDEQKDDDVVPYEEHTQNFDVRKVYGKVNGAGEYVQCFPNGMRGAGTAKDILTASEAVVKIGSVDLGTLNWERVYSSSRSDYYFRTNLSKGKNVASLNIVTQYYYRVKSIGDWGYDNRELAYGSQFDSGKNLYIRDDSYSSAADFKTAMNGVMANYELATPITYTDLIYRDGGIDRPLSDALMDITVNNWSIEEQLLTPYDGNGNPTAVPAKISTQYGMDAVEEIDTIKHTYVSAYSEQNFSDNQKAQARRNIGAVEEDGTYPNMSVGIAKNLAGENAVEAEYTYRQSNRTIGTNTGIANVTAIKGKTLKWQQKVNVNGASSTSGGGTELTISNNQFVINGTATSTYDYTFNNIIGGDGFVVGHKYLLKHSGSSNIGAAISVNNTYPAFEKNGGKIITISSVATSKTLFVEVTNGVVYDNDKVYLQIFDLTEMGLDSITSAAEFEALYPLDYYAYTPTPVLINNNASAIETTGFNQFPSTPFNAANISTQTWPAFDKTKYARLFANTRYYVRHNSLNVTNWRHYFKIYDLNGVELKFPNIFVEAPMSPWYSNSFAAFVESADNTGTNFYLEVSQDCYVFFGYGAGAVTSTTTIDNFCINLSDTAKNGTYEPYEKHTFYFDKVLQGEGSLATIKGKLNGEGESVVVFPDGLKRVGNVFDEIKGNVAIKRIGSVDLGNLVWQYRGAQAANVISTTSITNYAHKGGKLSVCYPYSAYNSVTNISQMLNAPDKCHTFFATSPSNALYIKDSDIVEADIDAQGHCQKLEGVILYYELATPETYILDQTVTGGYQVNALGTEKRLPEDTASAVNAPVNYSVIYPIDAVGTITKLPINYISEGSLTNFTTELASKLGTFLSATIGISATYNQTTQEYDYSITITSNE